MAVVITAWYLLSQLHTVMQVISHSLRAWMIPVVMKKNETL
jgi:hypothetical protein